jgi:zinc D-Ala-D-Ala carboxypeptidase
LSKLQDLLNVHQILRRCGGFSASIKRVDVRKPLTRTRVRAAALVLAAGFAATAALCFESGATFAAVQSSPRIVAGPAVIDVNSASSLAVVVNKRRPLNPIKYKPTLGSYNLAKPASDALVVMHAAMAKAGAGDLLLGSGYRGYYEQRAIYQRNLGRYGLTKTLQLTAKPGFSEHQTGLAADLWAAGQGCRLYPCFADTKAGKWLAANAWRYGFILRYPQGATSVTGYEYEPWHFRFVGKPMAKAMHISKIAALETFLDLPPAPTYVIR